MLIKCSQNKTQVGYHILVAVDAYTQLVRDHKQCSQCLTLSARQTKTYTGANSVDPDEMARKQAVSSGSTLFSVWFLD